MPMQRIDRVVRPSVWMRKMYTLVVSDGALYLLCTGPGVRNVTVTGDPLTRMAANAATGAVVNRGLAKITNAEAEITEGALDAYLPRHKGSVRIALGGISDLQVGKNGRSVRFKAPEGKFKFVFENNRSEDVQAFLAHLPR